MKTLSPKKVVDFLYENIDKVEEKFPYINHGGCGAFAVILYKKLLELNIKAQCIIIGRHNDVYTNKINQCSNVKELNKYVYIKHIILRVDNWYMDATALHEDISDFGYMCSTYVPIEIEALERMVNDTTGWNDVFNRKDIPEVEKLVNKLFKKAA